MGQQYFENSFTKLILDKTIQRYQDVHYHNNDAITTYPRRLGSFPLGPYNEWQAIEIVYLTNKHNSCKIPSASSVLSSI